MTINQTGVTVNALSLLVTAKILTEEELMKATSKGYDEIVELLKEKGEKYREDYNESKREESNN